MEKLTFDNEVLAGLRSRELRNLLVQKLGVDPALVNRIIDKEELRKLFTSVVYERLQQKARTEHTALVYKITGVVGVLTVLYLGRFVLWGLLVNVSEFFSESTYKSAKKGKLLVYNIKKKKFSAAVALAISLLLDFMVAWIQASIMLSWVVSADSPIRRYSAPSLSFPVSANTLVNAAGGKPVNKNTTADDSIGARISNYSMDIGPMLTMMALNFVSGKLDNFAAGIVLEHKRNKEERRYRRFYKNAPDGPSTGEGDEGYSGEQSNTSGERVWSAAGRDKPTVKTEEDIVKENLDKFFGRKRESVASVNSVSGSTSSNTKSSKIPICTTEYDHE